MEIQKIVVPLSENDLQELSNGNRFDWTFPDGKGNLIDVLVRMETQEDIEG